MPDEGEDRMAAYRRLMRAKYEKFDQHVSETLWRDDIEPCKHAALQPSLNGWVCSACEKLIVFLPGKSPSGPRGTDPLGRWCVKHGRFWNDVDGRYSGCPTCLAETYGVGSGEH